MNALFLDRSPARAELRPFRLSFAAEALQTALSGSAGKALKIVTRAIDQGLRDPLPAREPSFVRRVDNPDSHVLIQRMTDLMNAERDGIRMERLP